MNVILTVFNWVLISSLKACLIIPIIIIAKLVLKDKLSSSWHYFIWFLLVLGLILPVVPESPFSLYNFLPRFGTIDFKKYDVQDLSEKNIVNETGVWQRFVLFGTTLIGLLGGECRIRKKFYA